ncbi:MAG: DUF2007 domain-containing protein [Candidatus Aminicenantales bacterium]|jgi:hypothetical protein
MDKKKKAGPKPEQDEDAALDLKELCRVWGPFEADVVKSFLESNGITCLIRGRMVPFVYPFTVDGLAEFKIFVQEKDLETARALMASMPAPDEGGGPEEPKQPPQ